MRKASSVPAGQLLLYDDGEIVIVTNDRDTFEMVRRFVWRHSFLPEPMYLEGDRQLRMAEPFSIPVTFKL